MFAPINRINHLQTISLNPEYDSFYAYIKAKEEERKEQTRPVWKWILDGLLIGVGLAASFFTGGGSLSMTAAGILGITTKAVVVGAKSILWGTIIANTIWKTTEDIVNKESPLVVGLNFLAIGIEGASLGLGKIFKGIPRETTKLLTKIASKTNWKTQDALSGIVKVAKGLNDGILPNKMSISQLSRYTDLAVKQHIKVNTGRIVENAFKQVGVGLKKQGYKGLNEFFKIQMEIRKLSTLSGNISYLMSSITKGTKSTTNSLIQHLGNKIKNFMNGVRKVSLFIKKIINAPKLALKKFIFKPIDRITTKYARNAIASAKLNIGRWNNLNKIKQFGHDEAHRNKNIFPWLGEYVSGTQLDIIEYRDFKWTKAFLTFYYNETNTYTDGSKGAPIPNFSFKEPKTMTISYAMYQSFLTWESKGQWEYYFAPHIAYGRRQAKEENKFWRQGLTDASWINQQSQLMRNAKISISLFAGVNLWINAAWLAFTQYRFYLRTTKRIFNAAQSKNILKALGGTKYLKNFLVQSTISAITFGRLRVVAGMIYSGAVRKDLRAVESRKATLVGYTKTFKPKGARTLANVRKGLRVNSSLFNKRKGVSASKFKTGFGGNW